MDGGDGGAGKCMERRRDVDGDINRILLKYRPIAPKPVVGGSGTSSGGSSLLNGKRTKRKYVRVSSVRSKNKDKEEEEKRVVTLQLLPERVDPVDSIAQLEERKTDVKYSNLRASEEYNNNNNNTNSSNSFDINSSNLESEEGLDRVIRGIVSSRVVESCVMLESVDNNLFDNDQYRAILNDGIVQHQLESDSYPVFISKAESGRVRWVNEAYRRMIGCGSNAINHTPLIVVRLEIKETAVEAISCVRNGFSCWVKVQYNINEDTRNRMWMLVPCDAWRVESGAFAWRLDAQAALCLGMVTDNVNSCFHPS